MANLLMPLQIERQYSGSLDANFSFDTLEELKNYATTSALSYSGQILYCKGTDTIYKVNSDKTDVTELGGEGGSSENYYEVSVKVKFNTLYNTVSCSNYSGRYQDIKDAYDRGDKIKLLVDYSFTSEADASYQYGLDLAFVNVNDGSFNFELVDKNNNHCLITIDANNSISVIGFPLDTTLDEESQRGVTNQAIAKALKKADSFYSAKDGTTLLLFALLDFKVSMDDTSNNYYLMNVTVGDSAGGHAEANVVYRNNKLTYLEVISENGITFSGVSGSSISVTAQGEKYFKVKYIGMCSESIGDTLTTGIDRKYVNTGLTTYVSISDLNTRKGLSISLVANEDNTQKIIDALDVKEQFIEWFNNGGASTDRFGIDNTKYGKRINELKIVKMTSTDASAIAVMDSGVVLSRVYTNSTLGEWCVKKENTTGLISNAQSFKIDLTKNNPSWYGFFTFSFSYGATPCEITVSITTDVYYTITKGQNVVSAITYTRDGANYIIGIDFIAKMYGTQVVEMPSEFGTINSLTAETYAGDTTAILKVADLELMKGTKVVTEIGKSTYAVVQKILQDTEFTTTDRQARFEIVTKNVDSSTNGKHQTAQLYQITPIEGGTNASIQYIVYEDGRAQLTMYPHTNIMPRNDYNIVCEGYLNSKLDNLIYNSVAELNRAKGTNIELVNGEDNTQKIVDALSVGEQFISFYHNNANQNRFGIDVSYGNLIHELRITKCLDADLTANYATVTAFMNTGCVMSRIYYKTYSTAWSSTKDYVESLLANS